MNSRSHTRPASIASGTTVAAITEHQISGALAFTPLNSSVTHVVTIAAYTIATASTGAT